MLSNPTEWQEVRPGRVVCQGIVELAGKSYLLRIFIDVEPPPGRVVTVYRTSQIEKYRRQP